MSENAYMLLFASLASYSQPSFSCQTARMQKDNHIGLLTDEPPSPPPSAFYYQLALWIAVTVDLACRYWFRWKTHSHVENAVDSAPFKLSFDDGFVLLSFLPFTAYTWLQFRLVLVPHSTTIFFASRIPLQYTLVCTQLAQIGSYKRMQETEWRVQIHMCTTSLLAMISAVLVTCWPTVEMPKYSAIIIALATVGNEVHITAILVHAVWTTRRTFSGMIIMVAWVLRIISAIITALVGGYYLRTFWPPWSIQVVLCQQLNLLYSVAITRGLGAWSAWRQYMRLRRPTPCEQSQSNVRHSIETPWVQQQGIELTHDPECVPTHSQTGDGQSATSITSLLKSKGPTDAQQPMNDQMINDKLGQTALDALSGTIFGSIPWSQSQSGATSERNLECADEPGNSLTGSWSVGAGSQTSITDEDMIKSLNCVRIIGVERSVAVNGEKWRYLTKPDDMTCTKHLAEGMEHQYGYVRHALTLHNDYQYISFEPKWIGPEQLPREMMRELWEVIGRIFWHHTSLTHSARWQGTDERYQNLSTGLSMHLCARRECETCSAIHE